MGTRLIVIFWGRVGLWGRATIRKTMYRRSNRESSRCAGNWACSLRRRRTRGACISICKGGRLLCLQRIPTSKADSSSSSITGGTNSTMVGISKAMVSSSRVDILVVRNRAGAARTKTTITIMTSLRNWLRSSCRRLLGSWRDAALLCSWIWVVYDVMAWWVVYMGTRGSATLTFRFVYTVLDLGDEKYGYVSGFRISTDTMELNKAI